MYSSTLSPPIPLVFILAACLLLRRFHPQAEQRVGQMKAEAKRVCVWRGGRRRRGKREARNFQFAGDKREERRRRRQAMHALLYCCRNPL